MMESCGHEYLPGEMVYIYEGRELCAMCFRHEIHELVEEDTECVAREMGIMYHPPMRYLDE